MRHGIPVAESRSVPKVGGKVVPIPILGGLHHHYRWTAWPVCTWMKRVASTGLAATVSVQATLLALGLAGLGGALLGLYWKEVSG